MFVSVYLDISSHVTTDVGKDNKDNLENGLINQRSKKS